MPAQIHVCHQQLVHHIHHLLERYDHHRCPHFGLIALTNCSTYDCYRSPISEWLANSDFGAVAVVVVDDVAITADCMHANAVKWERRIYLELIEMRKFSFGFFLWGEESEMGGCHTSIAIAF